MSGNRSVTPSFQIFNCYPAKDEGGPVNQCCCASSECVEPAEGQTANNVRLNADYFTFSCFYDPLYYQCVQQTYPNACVLTLDGSPYAKDGRTTHQTAGCVGNFVGKETRSFPSLMCNTDGSLVALGTSSAARVTPESSLMLLAFFAVAILLKMTDY